jgi:hypothetical protein
MDGFDPVPYPDAHEETFHERWVTTYSLARRG